mmetsp:Transcript_1378/g.5476  ORF Transcript_1378/g.5476 Transcript_1378/m.5476 type:complete len:236 (-) Transcript_1378:1216-1923(-)
MSRPRTGKSTWVSSFRVPEPPPPCTCSKRLMCSVITTGRRPSESCLTQGRRTSQREQKAASAVPRCSGRANLCRQRMREVRATPLGASGASPQPLLLPPLRCSSAPFALDLSVSAISSFPLPEAPSAPLSLPPVAALPPSTAAAPPPPSPLPPFSALFPTAEPPSRPSSAQSVSTGGTASAKSRLVSIAGSSFVEVHPHTKQVMSLRTTLENTRRTNGDAIPMMPRAGSEHAPRS